MAEAIATHPVDVVLNNAGYGLMGALEALSDEQILKELNTNLLGVIRVTHALSRISEKGKAECSSVQLPWAGC